MSDTLNTYERQFNQLLSQFIKYYPDYKMEQHRGISTEITANFTNVERNLNNLFKDMILLENDTESKVKALNNKMRKHDHIVSLYRKELKREKRQLADVVQRNKAGIQFKEQLDATKTQSTKTFYYDLFGVVCAVVLILRM